MTLSFNRSTGLQTIPSRALASQRKTGDDCSKSAISVGHHLRIDLDYGEYQGPPLLFSLESRIEETGFKVIMQFGVAPEGSITFNCNDVSLDPGSSEDAS